MRDDKSEVEADLVIRNMIDALIDPKANQSLETEQLMNAYYELKASFDQQTALRDLVMQRARIRAKLQMSAGLFALVGYFNFVGIGTYMVWSWDIVEPLAYFLGLTGSIFVTSRYFKLRNDYENSSYLEYLTRKNFRRLAPKLAFDLAEYELLRAQMNSLKNRLKLSMLIDL